MLFFKEVGSWQQESIMKKVTVYSVLTTPSLFLSFLSNADQPSQKTLKPFSSEMGHSAILS